VPYVEPENGYGLSNGVEYGPYAWNKTGLWEAYELSICENRNSGFDPRGSFNEFQQHRPIAKECCWEESLNLHEVAPGHFVACIL
jgi:hypothetical protein